MKLLMIGFEDGRSGQCALDALEFAGDESGARFMEVALVYRRSECGTPRIRHTSDIGSVTGLLRGGLLGLLAAIASPPGLAISGALAGVMAGVGDEAVENPMMRSLAMAIHENMGVVLALCEDEREVDDATLPFRADIECHRVPEATIHLIRELSRLSMEDLECVGSGERTMW